MTNETIDELWKRCEAERMKVMKEARAEAEKWKQEGDMYGWNFWMGIASGTIEAANQGQRDSVAKVLSEHPLTSEDLRRVCSGELAEKPF